MNETSVESVEYVLKNFAGTRYYPKFKLATWHPEGVLDSALANQVIEFIEWEEYIQEAPFDRYTDLSGIAEIRISIHSIIEIARRRRIVREPIKSALFGHDRARLEVAQSYERLMREATMIQVRSFSDRSAAAAWLEVPETILEPAAVSGR
jgi:hypothetical protein